MKKVDFTNHARLKIDLLKKHGVEIEEDFIRKTVIEPDNIEKGYKGRLIAQKELDEGHVLRVVYEEEADKFIIITLYPGRKKDMRKIKYSKDVDILLIELSDKPIDYAEEEGRIIIHFSKDGEPVLIEILDAKEFVLSSIASVIQEKEVALTL